MAYKVCLRRQQIHIRQFRAAFFVQNLVFSWILVLESRVQHNNNNNNNNNNVGHTVFLLGFRFVVGYALSILSDIRSWFSYGILCLTFAPGLVVV